MSDFSVTSPTLPTDSGIVSTRKEFSDNLTQDLSDVEIKQATQILLPIKKRWEEKLMLKIAGDPLFTEEKAMKLLSEFSDEITYTLAVEANLLVTVDVSPVLNAEPPVIEYIGVLPGHALSQYGFDHERKMWEVKKAQERGEAFLGADEEADSSKAKRRDKSRGHSRSDHSTA